MDIAEEIFCLIILAFGTVRPIWEVLSAFYTYLLIIINHYIYIETGYNL